MKIYKILLISIGLAFCSGCLTVLLARPMSYYYYLTDNEDTEHGEIIWFNSNFDSFGEGDTVEGPVRSNDFIGVRGRVVFKDRFITTKDEILHWGLPGDIVFLIPPSFNASPINFSRTLSDLRRGADHWFSSIDHQGLPGRLMTWIKLRGEEGIDVYQYRVGTVPFDSLVAHIQVRDRPIIFVDGQVEVEGILLGQLTIGSSSDMWLLNDVRYAESDPYSGEFEEEETESMLGMASEGDIIIRNNYFNGKANGFQNEPENWDRHSIVLNGSYISLGRSFTFQHHNDDWESYQGPSPDERGFVYLQGGIAQQRKGYLHRSNHGGTGYKRHFRYDSRLKTQGPPGFEPDDMIDFGEVEGEYDQLRISRRCTFNGVTVRKLTVEPGAKIGLVGLSALTIRDTLIIEGEVDHCAEFHSVNGSGRMTMTDGKLVQISEALFNENVMISLVADTMRIDSCQFSSPVSLNGMGRITYSTFDDPSELRWIGEIDVERSVFRSRGIAVTGENSRLRLTNCTIAGGNSYGIEIRDGADAIILNSVIGFQRYGIFCDNRSTITIRYCDVYGTSMGDYLDCQPGEGCFSSDPLFSDSRNGDHSLTINSPCINAGDPASPRDPDGTVADLGAFWLDRGLGNDDDEGTPPYPPFNRREGLPLMASPNPFNATTVIRFEASPINREATVRIIDLQGRVVFSQGKITPPTPPAIAEGEMTLTWDATAFPAGIYIVRVGSGKEMKTMKIVKVN